MKVWRALWLWRQRHQILSWSVCSHCHFLLRAHLPVLVQELQCPWDWLAGRAGNPASTTTDKKRRDLYNPHNTIPQKFMLNKRRNKNLRLIPRLPRQHPTSYFRYLTDTSLEANYLLQFPAFLASKSIPLWAKNVTLYCKCQSPCCIVSGDKSYSNTLYPCSHTVPQAHFFCCATYFLMEGSCIFLVSNLIHSQVTTINLIIWFSWLIIS